MIIRLLRSLWQPGATESEVKEGQIGQGGIVIPSDLKYTKEHEWVKVEKNTAVIGITDYAAGELRRYSIRGNAKGRQPKSSR